MLAEYCVLCHEVLAVQAVDNYTVLGHDHEVVFLVVLIFVFNGCTPHRATLWDTTWCTGDWRKVNDLSGVEWVLFFVFLLSCRCARVMDDVMWLKWDGCYEVSLVFLCRRCLFVGFERVPYYYYYCYYYCCCSPLPGQVWGLGRGRGRRQNVVDDIKFMGL